MPCLSPVDAWRKPGGGIAFSPVGESWSDRYVSIRCGKCGGCHLADLRDWAIRCVHEAQTHEENCFITLTYDEESLPADRSLDIEHWQKFAKRARKRFGRFRFFLCGEFGSQGGRPHWHACVFGRDWRKKFWKQNERGDELFVNDELEKTWGKGFVSIGGMSFDSAAYVAQYVLKEGPEGERGACSRNPGIGFNYFARYVDELYNNDSVIAKGKEFPIPRYYDNLLAETDPDRYDAVRSARVIAAIKRGRQSTDTREDHEIGRTRQKIYDVRRGIRKMRADQLE